MYSARWLIDCIKQNQVVDAEPYLQYENYGESICRIEFGKQHIPFTITEAIKIAELGT